MIRSICTVQCTAVVKFIISEKATKSRRNLQILFEIKNCQKKVWRFRHVFVAFSEYMTFTFFPPLLLLKFVTFLGYFLFYYEKLNEITASLNLTIFLLYFARVGNIKQEIYSIHRAILNFFVPFQCILNSFEYFWPWSKSRFFFINWHFWRW